MKITEKEYKIMNELIATYKEQSAAYKQYIASCEKAIENLKKNVQYYQDLNVYLQEFAVALAETLYEAHPSNKTKLLCDQLKTLKIVENEDGKGGK